jgi:hypothetical protein
MTALRRWAAACVDLEAQLRALRELDPAAHAWLVYGGERGGEGDAFLADLTAMAEKSRRFLRRTGGPEEP